MKKILTIIICLILLVGCSKEEKNTNPKKITITEEAISFAEGLNINFDKLDLDVDIIDSDGKSITLYLSREVMDDDSIEDYKKITDFIRTFVKDEKLYDYYSKEEWSSDSLVEKTKNVLLFVTIKKQDYKITIARMNGLSYKGSERTYSIYKINFLEK